MASRRRQVAAHPYALVPLAVVVVGHGYVASRWPIVDVVLGAAVVFGCWPGFSRGVLCTLVFVGPTFNPAVLGIGAGRVYLLQAVILGVILGGITQAFVNGLDRQAVAIAASGVLLFVVETFGRTDAGAAWVYRRFRPSSWRSPYGRFGVVALIESCYWR